MSEISPLVFSLARVRMCSVLGGGPVHQVPDHRGQLLVDGGERRAQLVRHLGDELGLEAVHDLERGDVDQVHNCPQTLLALPQHRLGPGPQVFFVGQRELLGGDVLVVQNPALGDFHDQPAEGLVCDIGIEGFTGTHLRAKPHQLPAGGVHEDHVACGVGDQHPVRKRLDDGVNPAFFGVEIGERPELLLLEVLGLPRQADLFSSTVDHDAQLIRLKWLGDEVVGAAFHGFDGGLDRGVARDDDDQDARVQLSDELQHLHSVLPRHLEVQQHQVRPEGLDHSLGRIPAGGLEHAEADPLQDALGPVPDVPLVVGNQDAQVSGSCLHAWAPPRFWALSADRPQKWRPAPVRSGP